MRIYPHFKKTTSEVNFLLLLSSINCGSVCTDKAFEEKIMTLRTEIISKHEEHHSIWQNKSTLKWCTKLGAEKRLLMRKERSDLENAIIEFYLSDKKLTITVDEVFEDWCEYESSRTEHTMKTINEYCNDYKRFLAKTDFISRSIHDVTEQDIVRLMKAIVYDGNKIPQKRYKSIKTIMRTIFNHAKIHMDIECISVKNVMDDLRFPSTAFKETNTEDSKQVFKHSEIKKIKEELKDTNDILELGILLTIETGMRVGELCTLKCAYVTENNLLIRQSEHRAKFGNERRYYIGEPKKGKDRDIVLNDDAKRVLKKLMSLHDSEWLFPNPKDATDWMRSHFFDKAIRKVCRRLGIPERSMHKLRKTYSSYILAQKDLGVTDKLVQAQLGHADISTTHQAYYYNIFDVEEQVNILSSIKIG